MMCCLCLGRNASDQLRAKSAHCCNRCSPLLFLRSSRAAHAASAARASACPLSPVGILSLLHLCGPQCTTLDDGCGGCRHLAANPTSTNPFCFTSDFIFQLLNPSSYPSFSLRSLFWIPLRVTSTRFLTHLPILNFRVKAHCRVGLRMRLHLGCVTRSQLC